jgi:hypothetical protein
LRATFFFARSGAGAAGAVRLGTTIALSPIGIVIEPGLPAGEGAVIPSGLVPAGIRPRSGSAAKRHIYRRWFEESLTHV